MKESNNTLEEQYIEFIYCMWGGKLKESRFYIHLDNEKPVNFKDDAVYSYHNDPVFRRIYDMNKMMCKQIIIQEDKK